MNCKMRWGLAGLVATIAVWQVARSEPDRAAPQQLLPGHFIQTETRGLYDPDPKHLWNRAHRHFHTRVAPDGQVFGEDEADPLLWLQTKHLLTGATHQKAIQLLDEFLTRHGERLIADPLKRAVFQHDLWAVFDWLATTPFRYPPETKYPREAEELQTRLAKIIRSVALTKDQIRALRDNYAAALSSKAFAARYDPEHSARPFLPPEMFDTTGPWVTINSPYEPVAISHAHAFSSSAFMVLINLPGGRDATTAYLRKLWDFPRPFVADMTFPAEGRVMLSPELPQFPNGTQVALIRKMLLIDAEGNIVPSNLTEDIQIRVFHPPSEVDYPHERDFYGDQDFFEFRMTRIKLFAAESGGLRAIARDEKDFITFSSHGMDPFEHRPDLELWRRRRVTMTGCAACHRNLGIHSVMSVRRMLRPNPFSNWFHPQTPLDMAAGWKQERHDWGLMRGLLHTNNTPRRQ